MNESGIPGQPSHEEDQLTHLRLQQRKGKDQKGQWAHNQGRIKNSAETWSLFEAMQWAHNQGWNQVISEAVLKRVLQSIPLPPLALEPEQVQKETGDSRIESGVI